MDKVKSGINLISNDEFERIFVGINLGDLLVGIPRLPS